jgi:hypothetical protein
MWHCTSVSGASSWVPGEYHDFSAIDLAQVAVSGTVGDKVKLAVEKLDALDLEFHGAGGILSIDPAGYLLITVDNIEYKLALAKVTAAWLHRVARSANALGRRLKRLDGFETSDSFERLERNRRARKKPVIE